MEENAQGIVGAAKPLRSNGGSRLPEPRKARPEALEFGGAELLRLVLQDAPVKLNAYFIKLKLF